MSIKDHGGQFGGGEKERWVYDIKNLNVLPYINNFITPDKLLTSGVSKLSDLTTSTTITRDFKGYYYGVFKDQSGNSFVGRYSKDMERIQEEYKYNAPELFSNGLNVFKSYNKAILVGVNGGTTYYRVYSISEDGTMTALGSKSVMTGDTSVMRFLFDEVRDRMYFINTSTKQVYVYTISGALGGSETALAVHSVSDFPYSSMYPTILKSGDIVLSLSGTSYRYSMYSTLVRHGAKTGVNIVKVLHEDEQYIYVMTDTPNIHRLDKSLNYIDSILLNGAGDLTPVHEIKGKGVLMMRRYAPNVLFMLDTRTFTLGFFILPNVHSSALSSNGLWMYRFDTTSNSIIMDDDRKKLITVGNYSSVTVSQNTQYYKAVEFSLKV